MLRVEKGKHHMTQVRVVLAMNLIDQIPDLSNVEGGDYIFSWPGPLLPVGASVYAHVGGLDMATMTVKSIEAHIEKGARLSALMYCAIDDDYLANFRDEEYLNHFVEQLLANGWVHEKSESEDL